jgi:hypothetical protein
VVLKSFGMPHIIELVELFSKELDRNMLETAFVSFYKILYRGLEGLRPAGHSPPGSSSPSQTVKPTPKPCEEDEPKSRAAEAPPPPFPLRAILASSAATTCRPISG